MLLLWMLGVLELLPAPVDTKYTSPRSVIYRFIAEQAIRRNWRAINLADGFSLSNSKELANTLSSSWVKFNYKSDDEPVLEKYGSVCIELEPSDPPCAITSNPTSRPRLIVSNIIREKKIKLELQDSKYLAFDSDIFLAIYQENATIHGEIKQYGIVLQQVYKIQGKSNLTVIDLGFWEPNGTVPDAFESESRLADGRFQLRVGIKNFTVDENYDPDKELIHPLTKIVEREEDKHIFELVKCVLIAMNISYETVPFARTGWRNEEGAWTHLLGAVADGQVDIAADTVDMSTSDIGEALQLSNPIVPAMSNVYYRRPEGFRVRDVLSSTFSKSLNLCVLLMMVLLGLAMLIMTYASGKQHLKSDGSQVSWGLLDAFMWTVGVICMQGSPWSPRSASGCLLLLLSLIFALIIFNSFAAFITAVLSVQDNGIRNVDDLLREEFAFGYTKQSAEELFLRATDDRSLLSLYYRGLVGGGGLPDVTGGMLLASNQHFAFFASARLARRALFMVVPPRMHCSLLELCIPATRTAAAIPISKLSPYKKSFQYWLLRMRQTGILHRMMSRLLPPMPDCSTSQQKFTGVRASDLKIAYYIYLLGVCASCMILLGEIMWSQRKTIFKIKSKTTHGTALGRNQHGNYRPKSYSLKTSDFVN